MSKEYKEFPSAKIVAHSKAPNGEELITMEIELHRFILPEFNTHRIFSRNFQSSRAVPVEKMIEQVRNFPAFPVHIGKNQRGMVADQELLGKAKHNAEHEWLLAARNAANTAEAMNKLGVHKQVVNRVLEPFMKTKGIVTATRCGFESFFKLRSHKDAQPEIKALSDKMKEAIDNSLPEELRFGEYHLPYVTWSRDDRGVYFVGDSSNLNKVEDAIKVSASCCAQVSYRVLDDSLDKALKIYNMLNLPENGVYPEDPPHFSPTEHVAKVMDSHEHESLMSGNFSTGTFWQYRKALEIGEEDRFIQVSNH